VVKWLSYRSFAFFFLLQLFFSPASHAVETGNVGQPEVPLATGASSSLTSNVNLTETSREEPGGSVEKSLTRLFETSVITVLEDVDGQYADSMNENQMLPDDFVSQLAETDLFTSIRYGRNFSRESLSAKARTEQARKQTRQAFGLLLPSASLRGSYGFETSKPSVRIDEETGEAVDSETHRRTDASLTLSQPVFNLPNFLDWRRRKVNEHARERSYQISDGDAYLATVNTYLSLVASRLQADVARDFETQLAGLLEYIEKRAAAGASSFSDMARVKARSQATLSSRMELESAHVAAGMEFIRLTNLVPHRVHLPTPDDIGADVLPGSFRSAVSTAMKSNPEIAVLLAELEAVGIEQTAVKGQFVPRLDLEYTDTYSRHAGGSLDSQRDKRLMLVMNWNLLNGGKDYNYYGERVARFTELQYLLDGQRRRVIQELSANYAALETTRRRIASGYLELDSISTAVEAMSKRMISGDQSLLDLLDVYDQFHQVRARLVSLHIFEMNTMAQLLRLTLGAPVAEPRGYQTN